MLRMGINPRRWIAPSILASGCLLALSGSAPARADIIPPGQQLRSAIEVEALPSSQPDVKAAIKNFADRDSESCLKNLAKAVKANPELPPPHALFAKLAFLSNQGALVRPALERAAVEDRDHPEVYILFANLALAEGRGTDAAVHLEKAATLATAKRWTPDQRKRFEKLCHQGNAALAESRADWEAAKATLTAWLAQDPKDAQVRRRLGIALFGAGQRDLASKELQQAAKDDPKLESAAMTLGWLYTRDRNPKKAEEWMLYAAKTLPDALPVRLGVASWMLEQGRADDAQTHADAAAKIDPKSSEAKRLLGLVARQKKDYPRAEAIFQAIVQDAPADPWPRNQLALALADQGDDAKTRKALELAELSVRQDSTAADGLITLGTVLYRVKRLPDAEKVLQAVVNGGKANSDAIYILARIRADQGHPETAPALVKSALAAPGLFIYKADAQQWLDHLAAAKPAK